MKGAGNTFSDVNLDDVNMYWHIFEKNDFLLKVLFIKMDECCYTIKVKQTK